MVAELPELDSGIAMKSWLFWNRCLNRNHMMCNLNRNLGIKILRGMPQQFFRLQNTRLTIPYHGSMNCLHISLITTKGIGIWVVIIEMWQTWDLNRFVNRMPKIVLRKELILNPELYKSYAPHVLTKTKKPLCLPCVPNPPPHPACMKICIDRY